MTFDRKLYFDAVRGLLFGGAMSDQQVQGQEAILTEWEAQTDMTDLRWLSYMLATTFHETDQQMWPIEEYYGSSQSYGQPDPDTGQCYYGRGFVQLTHRENYRKASAELGLAGGERDLEWHAEHALDLDIATWVMFRGMDEGWFRSPNKLSTFFSSTADDPVGARNIINGDVSQNGERVAGYHDRFYDALLASEIVGPIPVPPQQTTVYKVTITAPAGDVSIEVERLS